MFKSIPTNWYKKLIKNNHVAMKFRAEKSDSEDDYSLTDAAVMYSVTFSNVNMLFWVNWKPMLKIFILFWEKKTP